MLIFHVISVEDCWTREGEKHFLISSDFLVPRERKAYPDKWIQEGGRQGTDYIVIHTYFVRMSPWALMPLMPLAFSGVPP